MIELSRQQEITKQHEAKTKQAEYEAYAKQAAVVWSPCVLPRSPPSFLPSFLLRIRHPWPTFQSKWVPTFLSSCIRVAPLSDMTDVTGFRLLNALEVGNSTPDHLKFQSGRPGF